jgi:VanZ family protein
LSGDDLERLGFDFWDKAAHFAAFAAGSVLLVAALALTTKWSWRRIAWLAVIVIALFGATDEWHQLYTPKRSGADLYDWIADFFGAGTGACAALLIHARYQRKTCPAPARD